MEFSLTDLLGKCVWVFIDDLVITSRSQLDHEWDLEALFNWLRAAKLQLKASKYHFGKQHIQLLSYIITPEGIQSKREKVKDIPEMLASMHIKQVRSFVGINNYYSNIIPGYAKLTEPLYFHYCQNPIDSAWLVGITQQGQEAPPLNAAVCSSATKMQDALPKCFY